MVLCYKNCCCFLLLAVLFASLSFTNSDTLQLLDDGDPDENFQKEMVFAENMDMLPEYLRMKNVSIDASSGNITLSLSKSHDPNENIMLPLITKNKPKLSFTVVRTEDCLHGSDVQIWKFAFLSEPRCNLFIHWSKYIFFVSDGIDLESSTVKFAQASSFGVYEQNIFTENGRVCLGREDCLEPPAVGCKFPPSVCVLNCAMNFSINNVNDKGSCDLLLKFNGSNYMLESAPPTKSTSELTTLPYDDVKNSGVADNVELRGLETWKLCLIIGVSILVFLLLVGAIACFLIHRFCPDDSSIDANEAGKNDPSKVVPTGRKPRTKD